jgi:hypothetical protein
MRCPVCKAENAQGPQCRRCKADLSPLFALEDQRLGTLVEVRRCIRLGAWEEAARLAETADWLRADEESQRLTMVTHLLEGDFAETWQSYQRWRGEQNGRGSEERSS